MPSGRYGIVFIGMRLGEICQLEVSDIIEKKGFVCFDINDQGDGEESGKSVKTEAGKRCIPMHPVLIDLGFLDYFEKAKQNGLKRIWPLKGDSWRDRFTHTFSKWYGYHSKKRISDSDKKCFHSLRHSFINNLRQRGVPENVIADIVGHANPTQTGGRYGKPFEPKPMIEAILKLDYEIDVFGLLGVEKPKGNTSSPSKAGIGIDVPGLPVPVAQTGLGGIEIEVQEKS